MMNIIMFSATSCHACQQMKRLLKKEFPEIDVKIVDVDEDPETTMAYGVYSLPTLIFLENNRCFAIERGLWPDTISRIGRHVDSRFLQPKMVHFEGHTVATAA